MVPQSATANAAAGPTRCDPWLEIRVGVGTAVARDKGSTHWQVNAHCILSVRVSTRGMISSDMDGCQAILSIIAG